MKKIILILVALIQYTALFAQSAAGDPVIMTINGKPVPRSEFEYSYNKNNGADVIDKKTVAEYADLFINYKLKVCAALDARLDTVKAFRDEYTMYRDQQIRPTGESLVEEFEAFFAIGRSTTHLTDRDENGAQVLHKHQEVVDRRQCLSSAVAHRTDEGDAVEAAQRMVGGHQDAVARHQVLLALNDHLEVKIVHHRVDEVDAFLVGILRQDLVDVVLMQQSLDLTKEPVGHVFHQLGHLGSEDFPQVD